MVTLQECCEKCRTSSQMPNMLICCMFTASVIVAPRLLLKNTVNGFLSAEFWIVVLSKVFDTLCEHGTLPIAHVSSERAYQQHVEEQESILEMVQHSPTTSMRRLSTYFSVSRALV
jgi:hypothetical protein